MRSAAKALIRLVLIVGVAALVYVAWLTPAPRPTLAARSGPSIHDARTWGYQLQDATPDRIAAGIDILVIDSQKSEQQDATLSADMVARFKSRPDGKPRIVLAYLSIGEAETYRYYWRSYWSLLKPSFIGPENAEWKGNYRVRFWERGWQTILFGGRRSMLDAALERFSERRVPYLDRILEAGFDGVYLDRVDVYDDWSKERSTAEGDMIALVGAISAYAKGRRPGFLVVPQNGEELLRSSPYRRNIDAIAKEDLFFGIDHKEGENAPAEVASSVALLGRARADKIPVLVVEYLDDADKRARAEARARERGFLLNFATRKLNQPPELPPQPAAVPAAAPAVPSPAVPAQKSPPAQKPNKG